MTELQRRISPAWVAFRELGDVFKGNLPNHLKEKMDFPSHHLRCRNSQINPKKYNQIKSNSTAIGEVYAVKTIRNRVRNEEIWRRTYITDIIEKMARLKWNWAGHIPIMNDGYWTRKIINLRKWAEEIKADHHKMDRRY